MNVIMIRLFVLCIISASLSYASAAAATVNPSFQGLGCFASECWSVANAVSADGSIVVGFADYYEDKIFKTEAFRWTEATGIVRLGFLSGGRYRSTAIDISADGKTIVGQSSSVNDFEAVQWTTNNGIQSLGVLPSGSLSAAAGTSGDGSLIVGLSSSVYGQHAFRWALDHGIQLLDDSLMMASWSEASDVTRQGEYIVGTRALSSVVYEAFCWSEDGGIIGLGDLPGGSFNSLANSISANGTVIVGNSKSTLGSEAFRWTWAQGMVGLGDLPGGNFESDARDVSGDGKIIVGESNSARGQEAFIWTSAGGMRSLSIYLRDDIGLELEGWILQSASGISADGSTIVGTGLNPEGKSEAWIARIPALTIPEPASSLLLISGIGSLIGIRMKNATKLQSFSSVCD